ncbi:MAG TPA: MFS transporter [Burkholderiales bacterium]|jgi:hypothetical protein|nr:MFS transporter [Burkholderiales bacterium]
MSAQVSLPHRVGVYLGVVQFLFAMTWIVYVIYLPQLAAKAGIPKQWILPILMLDQAIFAVMDCAMGMAADRMARIAGRVSRAVLAVTLASCAAFLLMPIAAPAGGAGALVVLIVLWSVTSSALRAPPLVLLAKYAPPASQPWLASLSLLGLGVAGAAAPYVGMMLAGLDPRIPFAIASLALGAATLGMLWAEKTLAHAEKAGASSSAGFSFDALAVAFLAAVLLLALGIQIHVALGSVPQYLRFAKATELAHLLPMFWVGFNLAMLPAGFAAQRYGAVPLMAAAGIAGAGALFAAAQAGGLPSLVAFQLLAGGAWACVLAGAVGAALSIGRAGREGLVAGGVFALIALATFTRMAFVYFELNKSADFTSALAVAPTAAWLVAGVLLIVVTTTVRKKQGYRP